MHSPSNVFTKAPITFFKISGFDDENCWTNLQQMVFIAYANVNHATPADIQVLKALAPCIYRYSSPALDCELAAERSPAISMLSLHLQRCRSSGPAQFALQTCMRSSNCAFAVKFSPAWSFVKITKSYMLKLVFLKCFPTTLEREVSKQKNLDDFFSDGRWSSQYMICPRVVRSCACAQLFPKKQKLPCIFFGPSDSTSKFALQRVGKGWSETPSSLTQPDSMLTQIYQQAAHASIQNPQPGKADA